MHHHETRVVSTFRITPEGVVTHGDGDVPPPGISLASNLQAEENEDPNATIEALKKENIDAANYIHHIQGQMNSLQNQVLLMENNSTGNYVARFVDKIGL